LTNGTAAKVPDTKTLADWWVMDEKAGDEKVTALQVSWKSTGDLTPVFADNLHLARINDQFYQTFGQLRLSVGDGPNRPEVGNIYPVAQFVVPVDALRRISVLLSQYVENAEARQK
jgi:hypothetical protein